MVSIFLRMLVRKVIYSILNLFDHHKEKVPNLFLQKFKRHSNLSGADKQRKGRFEQSSGGSLFLDEIGDMPLPLQTKLLRVLENRTVQRVGGNDEIEVDFRLVCATHQDIQARVDDGGFRAESR